MTTYALQALDPAALITHRARFGGPNRVPPNAAASTAEEFESRLFANRPAWVEYRQAYGGPWTWAADTVLTELRLFGHHDTTGVGYWLRRGDRGWERSYITFAWCLHTWRVELLGRGAHRYTCTACGYTHVLDSTD